MQKKTYSLPLIITIILLAIALGVIWWMIHMVIIEKEEDFDTAVISYLSAHVTPGMTGFMKSMTFLGSRQFLLTAYLIIICWFIFFQKRRRTALNVAVIGSVGILLVTLLKNVFQRPRPMHPMSVPLDTYSFPSGHTTSGFIFFGLLIVLSWKAKIAPVYKYILSILLLLISVLIGISRIYLGMHFPSDVIAGFCLGYAWLAIAVLVLEKFNKKEMPQELKAN